MRFTIQKEHSKLIAELEKQYQEQIALLNKKVYLLENGFKDGQAVEK